MSLVGAMVLSEGGSSGTLVGMGSSSTLARAASDLSAASSARSGARRVSFEEEFRSTSTVSLRSDAKGNAYLNQYVVIKDLGQGAFGKVKLCLNTQNNRLCAIKCINRKLLRRKYAGKGKDGGGRAVRKEIAIMKKLSHENVVRLYEVIDDETGNYIFMVLEYVAGGPVYEPDKFDGKGMGEELAWHYFRETCDGLNFLHVNGVIHRDLKPDNLLKTTDGTVKISDFGVSELFDEDEGDADADEDAEARRRRLHHEVSGAVGTAAFLAPEIARGGRARGKPSDVWSLGVCLYYIVCGEVPFRGDSVAEVTRMIVEEEATFPDSASPELASLLAGLLRKDPDERFTMEQIVSHPWVTKGGDQALEVDVDPGEARDVTVSEEDLRRSISYQSEHGFFDSPAETRTFAPGEYLIRQGDQGDEMFIIESGEVEVITPKNRKRSLRRGAVEDPTEASESASDSEDEIDMSDDIVAAAMMNRDASDEDIDDAEDRGKNDGRSRGAPGIFACCFGGGVSAEEDSNAASMVRRSAPSAHAVIATRGPGDIIGEMSLLSAGAPATRSASVRAVVTTTCSVISKEEMWKSLRGKPEVLEELRLAANRRESELLMGQTQLKVGQYQGPDSIRTSGSASKLAAIRSRGARSTGDVSMSSPIRSTNRDATPTREATPTPLAE